MQRHIECDVAVVGGGAAGIAAAELEHQELVLEQS